jgi:hypothetical protein
LIEQHDPIGARQTQIECGRIVAVDDPRVPGKRFTQSREEYVARNLLPSARPK